ncbi:hypothetical protein IQ07DRAFT_583474, partial [Pyrenochaeta sp. DS3sAY3a]
MTSHGWKTAQGVSGLSAGSRSISLLHTPGHQFHFCLHGSTRDATNFCAVIDPSKLRRFTFIQSLTKQRGFPHAFTDSALHINLSCSTLIERSSKHLSGSPMSLYRPPKITVRSTTLGLKHRTQLPSPNKTSYPNNVSLPLTRSHQSHTFTHIHTPPHHLHLSTKAHVTHNKTHFTLTHFASPRSAMRQPQTHTRQPKPKKKKHT